MSILQTLRRALFVLFAAALVVPAGAAETAYVQQKFDAAVAAGQPVIVHFAADWCPTCQAQKPVASALLKEPRFAAVTLFRADFDTEKALEARLGVTQQSTYVVFKGGKEVARSTAKIERETLATLFAQAL